MRILLVEDSELVADAIARGLSLAGFAVHRVNSAERAEAALQTDHFAGRLRFRRSLSVLMIS